VPDLDAISFENAALAWASLFSLVVFVGSVVALPIVIVRLPADYFAERAETQRPGGVLATILLCARNLVGIALLLTGVALLFLPGQGLLMILASVVVMEFPGKKRLERRLIARAEVLRVVNRIRARFRAPPFAL
jgi:hypothetical protein